MAVESRSTGEGPDRVALRDNNPVDEPREYPEYILPHSEFGDPECCGLFLPVERGDMTDITCNECGSILKSVPSVDLRRILDEMELSLGVASEQCPRCGSVNLFSGFDSMDDCRLSAPFVPSRHFMRGHAATPSLLGVPGVPTKKSDGRLSVNTLWVDWLEPGRSSANARVSRQSSSMGRQAPKKPLTF